MKRSGRKKPERDNEPIWKQRFRVPMIVSATLAETAPRCGLVVSNKSGAFQLYAWDVMKNRLRQLTDRPEGVPGGVLSPDGRYVYYLDDKQGNEIGHYVRVPFEGGKAQDVTPQLPAYSSWDLCISRAGNLAGFVAGVSGELRLYCLGLGRGETVGEPRLVYQSNKLTIGPLLSSSGQVAVVGSTERSGKAQYSLLAFDTASGGQIAELWDGPGTSVEAYVPSPLPGDTRLLAATNRTGVRHPVIWNPRSGQRIDLDLKDLEGEIGPWDWSPDGKRILLCRFNNAVQQFYTYDLGQETLVRLDHPSGSFNGASFAPSGEILTVWEDATHPSQVVALDARTGRKRRMVLSVGKAPPSRPWKSITFKSSDGQEIQGWLGVPGGKGPFPAVIDIHGGPWMVMTDAYRPRGQAWMDHGFASLAINYRGSITFGREFQDRILGHVGHWELEDIVAARDWLVREGIAKPDRVLLTGWSYGGYLTLYALGKRPDLWAGGMAGIAVADWSMAYEDEADTLKGFDVAIFGGTPEEKPEKYRASSPITYAESVKAPVLIIQGRNDTRCPPRQIGVYEKRMKDLGKSIEVFWFDTGHGSLVIEQEIEQAGVMLRFAQKIPKGAGGTRRNRSKKPKRSTP